VKIHLKETVFDAALDRIRYLFNEFDKIVVSFSGGKDSTVTLELALIVAREQGKLPLTVMFLDQEAEWQAVVDYVREVMGRGEIEPHWLQVPIKLFNATTNDDPWLYCWRDGDDWMRPKEPNAITENVYNCDRFKGFFEGPYSKHHWPDQTVAMLAGVRAEESPNRSTALTYGATYKAITWGKKVDVKRGHYTFYPLYDWGWRDIWKSIHDHGWNYCEVYDHFYSHGISPMKMRVSNLHHETAVDQLFYLQEIERDTWNALTKRLSGINQARHMTKGEMFAVQGLPYMFGSWGEYRDYLVDKLLTDPDIQKVFKKKFQKMDMDFAGMANPESRYKAEISAILANDFEMTKIDNFTSKVQAINFRKWRQGKPFRLDLPQSHYKFIPEEFRP